MHPVLATKPDKQGNRRSAPVKVAYVVPPSDHFAGMERVTHELAGELAAQADVPLDVTVIYFSNYEEVRDASYKVVMARGARVRDVPHALHRILRHQDFDVVVIPQFENAVLSLLYNRARGRRDRIVLHLHGNPDIERRISLKSRAVFLLYAHAMRWFAGIIAVSPGLARSATASFHGKVRADYLPNPVRQIDASISTLKDGATGDPWRFVSVGRLAHQKGHDIAIRAFRQVVNIYPQATLAIVGEGSERAALQGLIDTLGLESNVILKGMISDPSIELAVAGAFVSASRWEGFGVAIVEALSAGLFVIATRCDFGPEDIITAPELGVLVAPEDPDALAAAMILHLSQPVVSTSQPRIAHAARFARDAVVAQHAHYLARFKAAR